MDLHAALGEVSHVTLSQGMRLLKLALYSFETTGILSVIGNLYFFENVVYFLQIMCIVQWFRNLGQSRGMQAYVNESIIVSVILSC